MKHLKNRLDGLEDSLTAKEAVICWMRETHQFDSLIAYEQWLLDQPEDVYPLVRMPARVRAGVKSRTKGTPDRLLGEQFHQADKEVLFLYYLHRLVNLRYLAENEPLHLRLIIASRSLRVLLGRTDRPDQLGSGHADLTGARQRRPTKKEQKLTAAYQAQVEAWPKEMGEPHARVLEFHQAIEILSSQYFAGEDLLFPGARDSLSWLLTTIASLESLYADLVLENPPESAEDLEQYFLRHANGRGAVTKSEPAQPSARECSRILQGAKRLAEQLILMARSEALDALGEHGTAESLADRLLRGHSQAG